MRKLTFLVIIALYGNALLGNDIPVSKYKDSELRINDFQSWKKANLKGLKVESYGSIKVTIETAEPEATVDSKTPRATAEN